MMHEVWSDVCKEAWFPSSSLNREVTKQSYGCKCRSKSGARATSESCLADHSVTEFDQI